MGLTDEEFRAKLEKHFSLYRINLRSPIASLVIPHNWYRVDLLLVNELGLFRRADIEPDGQVELDCHLYHSMGEDGITPLGLTDNDWEIKIRAAPGYQQGELSKERYPVPGFYGTGKGTFEYCVVPKHANPSAGKRYLYIFPKSLHQFPKKVPADEQYRMENILPLMVGPIEINPNLIDQAVDTSKPLELWNGSDIEMVYDGYRVFSSSIEPPFVNIAIHEMWDSGIPGKIWDSALVMLDVVKNIIQHHPEYINDRHILDLSAGTGLLGLYVASLFHSSHSKISKGRVTITELDEALALIDQNVDINKYLLTETDSCTLKTRSLLWGNTKEAENCGKVELIIASDVLYESQFFEDLVKTFVDLSTKDTRIYIGYKRRGFDEAEEKRFWSLCSEYYNVKLLEYNGEQYDDCLVPQTTLGTGVQLYRLLPLQDKFA